MKNLSPPMFYIIYVIYSFYDLKVASLNSFISQKLNVAPNIGQGLSELH